MRYLETFYKHLAADNEKAILDMDIPHSSLFYIRAAIADKTGQMLSFKRIRELLKEEYNVEIN